MRSLKSKTMMSFAEDGNQASRYLKYKAPLGMMLPYHLET